MAENPSESHFDDAVKLLEYFNVIFYDDDDDEDDEDEEEDDEDKEEDDEDKGSDISKTVSPEPENKQMDLSKFPNVFKKTFSNHLATLVLQLKGADIKFYLAQGQLRENTFLENTNDFESEITTLLKDDSRSDKVHETVLLLHSTYSLLHNPKLPDSAVRNLLEALMFNLTNPKSRSNGHHCYLLKDIIADIIAFLFEKHNSEILLKEAIEFCHVCLNDTNRLDVYYGMIALLASCESLRKEFFLQVKDFEVLCRSIFLKAQSMSDSASKQSALTVKNKLMLLFRYLIQHWLNSTPPDFKLPPGMKFLTDFYVSSEDFSYHFCRDELLKYCLLPSKYLCKRMPFKTNKSSLTYLLPDKKEFKLGSESISDEDIPFNDGKFEVQEQSDDQNEEDIPFNDGKFEVQEQSNDQNEEEDIPFNDGKFEVQEQSDDENEEEENFFSLWSNKTRSETITINHGLSPWDVISEEMVSDFAIIPPTSEEYANQAQSTSEHDSIENSKFKVSIPFEKFRYASVLETNSVIPANVYKLNVEYIPRH